MRRERSAALLALALTLCAAAPAWSQDASVQAPPVAPGPVDPAAPLPPGHPPMNNAGGDPDDPHGGLQRMEIPESSATEVPSLPAGVVVVRVVDAAGNPIPEVSVRVGAMREGEAVAAQDVRTGPDGTARIERMDPGVAYRFSTDYEGARFGAPPFQLPPGAGYRVQIVRHAVSHAQRAILIWDARCEVRFKDDRAVVVERIKIVNLTAMSLGGAPTTPTTFVPSEGLRFGIPAGHTAFVAAPSMSDVHLTEEHDEVVFRGSIPPTTGEPVELVFQYQVKLEGGDVDLRMALPLGVVSAMVVSEAPAGLTLSVDGMPPATNRESEGQRVLITGVERRPDDPPVAAITLHLGGIPRAAGVARDAAAGAAGALALGALGYALSRRRRGAEKRTRAAVTAERDRVLAEMAELSRLRNDGEVGPQTFERRRRELAVWLATLLRELDDAPAGA